MNQYESYIMVVHLIFLQLETAILRELHLDLCEVRGDAEIHW